jgi:glycosyltransferase involved in cell wall biosynthesis
VPGRVGWLAQPGDAEDLAARILEALDAPLPPDAVTTAESLDWTRVAEKTLAVFERALRGSGRA